MAKQKSKSGENIKGDILSFRVPKEVREKVAIQLESKPVLKCESPHKFARKLMLDWVAGRLQYKFKA